MAETWLFWEILQHFIQFLTVHICDICFFLCNSCSYCKSISRMHDFIFLFWGAEACSWGSKSKNHSVWLECVGGENTWTERLRLFYLSEKQIQNEAVLENERRLAFFKWTCESPFFFLNVWVFIQFITCSWYFLSIRRRKKMQGSTQSSSLLPKERL